FKLGDYCNFDFRPLLNEWSARGCFMHSINHPKLFVLGSIARVALNQCGLRIAFSQPEDYLHDPLTVWGMWPVYPEIATRFGIAGNYQFKVTNWLNESGRSIEILNLE